MSSSGRGEGELEDLARTLLSRDLLKSSDFTLFYGDEDLKKFGGSSRSDWWYQYCCLRVRTSVDADQGRTSFDFEDNLKAEGATSSVPVRLQVSRAGKRTGWSITVRWEPPKDFLGRASEGDTVPMQQPFQESEWAPSSEYGFEERGIAGSEPFIFSVSQVVDLAYRLIFRSGQSCDGFVLVTGSTNSAKSKIARGLIWRRLDDLMHTAKRRLHLVTYEDPIEKPFYPTFGQGAIDVTQRSGKVDCGSVEEALEAALRQTPSVFYLGEIRREPDFRHAIDFAGTGHLIISTAHAGSLIEGFTKLLNAAEVGKSGNRAVHIPKILAVVHLKKLYVKAAIELAAENTYPALVPTLYRRTPVGVQDLVSDGLASLLPHYTHDGTGGDYGSLGRQFIAAQLCRNTVKHVQVEGAVMNKELRGTITYPSDLDRDRAEKAARQDGDTETWNEFQKWNGHLPSQLNFSGEKRLVDVALEEDLNG